MSTSVDGPILAIDTSTPTLVTGLVSGVGLSAADVRPGSTDIANAEAETEARAGAAYEAVENTVENTRAHNELLMPTIFELLDSAGIQLRELAAVVVGCGPGPFSGLRVGMATASSLGHALGIGVYGVCSHDAIAWRAQYEQNDASKELADGLLVATDARRRETYWAVYGSANTAAVNNLATATDPLGATPATIGSSENQTVCRMTGPEVGPAENLQPEVARVVANPTIAARLPENLRELAEADTAPAVPSARGLVAVADFNVAPRPLTPLYLRRPDAKEPVAKPVSAALRWADR